MNESFLSLRGLDGARRVHLRGANDASIAWWLVRVAREHPGPVVYVEEEQRRLEAIKANMKLFLGATGERDAPVLGFPAWDVYPFSRLSPSSEIVGERMSALRFLRGGGQGVVLTSVSAMGTRLPPPERLGAAMIHLREGMEIERDPFIGSLESLMYQRRSVVESPGEYTVRGGILDFFLPPERIPDAPGASRGRNRFPAELPSPDAAKSEHPAKYGRFSIERDYPLARGGGEGPPRPFGSRWA